jgi:AcrR family transcriptional regulator
VTQHVEARSLLKAREMRPKTDDRRQAIMAAAWGAFREKGFERTSMSEISQRVGGSKGTLYRYFKTKDALFAAALQQAMQERADAVFAQMTSAEELCTRLLGFARAYMDLRMTPDAIAVDRILIAEADRSALGAGLRAQFILPQWRRLARLFEQEMAAGRLRKADPYAATMHFRGLVEADVLERRLHGDAFIEAAQVEAAVNGGVEAFLRAYAP